VARVEFAIGAKRIAPLWRLLNGISDTDWTDAIDMADAQIAVADYTPDWWPAATRLLIRRVRLAPEQVSADPRAQRRRTLHPDQRVLPINQLTGADTVIYGYSFIVTNLDVSTPDKAAAVEHWYRHRTAIENIFRDAKLGAALRHLPSRYPHVNRAWLWGALLAASIAGWLHQLTAMPGARRPTARPRYPRRPSHDHHPAAPTDPGTRPHRPPRRRARPAPTTRTPPPRTSPRPATRTTHHVLTRPTAAPNTSGTPATRADTRAPTLPSHRKTTARNSTPRDGDQLIALLAESGLTGDLSKRQRLLLSVCHEVGQSRLDWLPCGYQR
jgi:hypothetical protein